MLKIFILISVLLGCAFAAHGIDIATFMGPYNISTWQCLHDHGIDFAIIQIWRGHHQLSDHFPLDWQNAKAVGIYQVDAYAYVCNNCPGNTPKNICTVIQNTLPAGFDGMLWIDVEDCKDCWVGTPEERLSFLEDIMATCDSMGFNLGVYSCHGPWSMVFGTANYTSGTLTNYPLWFGDYDNKESFDDFEKLKFGNWKAPVLKQYNAGQELCGITQLDLDAY